MAKRSDFKRRKHDDYRTPIGPVHCLIPHLPEYAFTFIEPCAGDGRLIRHIEQLREDCACVGAWDIEPSDPRVKKGSALEIPQFHADLIITNPPWTREILHPMIERFSAERPTWLLFDSDWLFTKMASPFIPWLRKIIPTPRVKWIEGSKFAAKDNTSWHLFDQNSTDSLQLIGRAA